MAWGGFFFFLVVYLLLLYELGEEGRLGRGDAWGVGR